MKSGINIRDLDSIKSLRNAILKFSEYGLSSIPTIDVVLKKEIVELENREKQFKKSLVHHENNLQQARISLANCESSGYYDRDGNFHEPDCWLIKDQVSDCFYQFQEYQRKYQECRKIISRVKERLETFSRELVKFKNLLSNHSPYATNALKQLIIGAEDYQIIQSNSKHNNDLNPTVENTSANSYKSSESNNPLGELLLAVTGMSAIAALAKEIFNTSSGIKYELSNTVKNNTLDFYITHNDKTEKVAKLSINEKNSSRTGKIFSNYLEDNEISEKILVNLEKAAVKNNCLDLVSWADNHQINLFKNNKYQIRNQTASGGEVYKTLGL